MLDVDEDEFNEYCLARSHGWAPGDEDGPKEYCDMEALDLDEVTAHDRDMWREEYLWWKARP